MTKFVEKQQQPQDTSSVNAIEQETIDEEDGCEVDNDELMDWFVILFTFQLLFLICSEHEDELEHNLPSTSAESPVKTCDPRFIQQFYSRSRLHHISTWALKLRDLVCGFSKL